MIDVCLKSGIRFTYGLSLIGIGITDSIEMPVVVIDNNEF